MTLSWSTKKTIIYAVFMLLLVHNTDTLAKDFNQCLEPKIPRHHAKWRQKQTKISAGILPYFYDATGKAYFLLGKEYNGDWCDFGGTPEEYDIDTLTTALRECAEETRLVFGKLAAKVYPLEQQVGKQDHEKYLQKSNEYFEQRIKGCFMHPKRSYQLYIAEVDFIPADAFNNAATIPNYEKHAYAWVPVDEFLDMIAKEPSRYKARYHNKKIFRGLYDILREYNKQIRTIIETHNAQQEEAEVDLK